MKHQKRRIKTSNQLKSHILTAYTTHLISVCVKFGKGLLLNVIKSIVMFTDILYRYIYIYICNLGMVYQPTSSSASFPFPWHQLTAHFQLALTSADAATGRRRDGSILKPLGWKPRMENSSHVYGKYEHKYGISLNSV